MQQQNDSVEFQREKKLRVERSLKRRNNEHKRSLCFPTNLLKFDLSRRWLLIDFSQKLIY